MNTFGLLFLFMLMLTTAVRLWLLRRQVIHVRAHRERVPEAFAGEIDPAEHRKAADYTIARAGLGACDVLLGTALTAFWTLGGGIDLLDTLWKNTGWSAVATGTGVIVSFALINAAAELPLSIWAVFVIEERFGFNRMTAKLFIADLGKSIVLGLVLGVPLAAGALWLMHAAGEQWWLWVWALWLAFSLLLAWAWPRFLAPLFNRFSPLPEGDLRTRVETLLARCGFRSRGVFVMDGSKRSAHGNAYFTGIGNSKRIVFFDTLLEALSPGEIEAVLAHELGHYRLRHVAKRLALTALLGFAGFALLGWIATQTWFYTGLGVTQPSAHAALLLFLLAGSVFAWPLTPLAAFYSRRHEYEADEYAARYSDAACLVDALVKLHRENATTLTPDPIYAAVHYSHPPALARIARLKRFAAGSKTA